MLASILMAAVLTPAFGQGFSDAYPQARSFFPQADRFEEPAGNPPAAAAYRGDRLLGYVYQTADVMRIPAYSGKPINTLVGLDVSGRITGIRIIEHEEPILLVGITEERLQRFAAQYTGKSVFDRIIVGGVREGHVTVDAISGATITVMVENATITRSARIVAESRGLPLPSAKAAPPQAERSTVRAAGSGTTISSTGAAPRISAAGTGVEPVAAGIAEEEPIWVMAWRERVFQITVLGAGLVALTLILVFQDWLARHPALLLYVRDGFLIYTLFFIGWYGLAQLSVVNVLTFVHAIMRDFSWESFLIGPMIFMLWSFVAATLLLWGRGVYCGWLCPFGALQELTFQLARRFKLPYWDLPEMVHERLWALKYIILLALFGMSLQSLAQAERLAEIEPFKTAITMRFQREWGFLAFAIGLVAVSAFNRKFYCKYLCALGAALTIPAKFRIFDWLRRHRECGRPCQVCAKECEVQAIRKNGEINVNECHYCLDCQVTYWNDQKCPPEVERRKRRERSVRARELVRGMEHFSGPSGLDSVDVKPDECPLGGPCQRDRE